MILAEALRNISRFKITSEIVNNIQNKFGKYVNDIVNKAKAIDLEIKYVPLFENFKGHLGQIESRDKEIGFAYKDVNLQKDDIAEIVSYGVKTIFEDSKTYIILV